MTRVDTRPSQTVTIKAHSNSANFCRFCSIILFAVFTSAVYFILKRPTDSLGDPSDQYTVKNIPEIYTRVEGNDPEDRDVFQGFRTSFLPPEEILLARQHTDSKRQVYEGNVTSDIMIWGKNKRQMTPTRVKRMSYFTFTSQGYDDNKRSRHPYTSNNQAVEVNESETEEDETETDYNQYDDDENLKRVVHPEMHVDCGPFDDVVEQIRGQPELEEGEMLSSAQIYKPSKSFTGIHSFWKGQGDRETIRQTQAKIMKQYMDSGADPCQDFYQYACGNWASLNPIPADKAGYDTFEMLRENLDTVLRDLLEFKPHENVICSYPGAHLNLDDTSLHIFNHFNDSILKRSRIQHNTRTLIKFSYFTVTEKKDLVNRIRRYLDEKSKKMKMMIPVKPLSKMKHNVKKYMNKNIKKRPKRHIPERRRRNAKKRVIRRKVVIRSKEIRYGRRLMSVNKRLKRNDVPTDIPADVIRHGHHRDPSNGDAALKARFLFKSCMNYAILSRRGHRPLLDLLNLLGGWPILDPKWKSDGFDWLELMAKLRLYNNDILISEWVGPDIKNSDEFVIQFDQTSLGLPTRDYFLQESNKMYLDAYKQYLETIAMLLGGNMSHVQKSANRLIQFEINLALVFVSPVEEPNNKYTYHKFGSLAKITSAPEDRRNVSELYRRMPLWKLEELVPQVQWRKYLCIVMNRTVYANETVVFFALCYVRHLVKLIEQTDPSTLANYLLWRFVRHRVNNLDDRFQSAKQQFYYTLFGREQAPPRWKNCVSQVNSNMGMALGSMFVRKYFDEMSKNDTLKMTRAIQKSFRELLSMTDWIDNNTKELAAHKVDAMMLRIGYPDFILNKKDLDDRYKEVQIHPDKYFENILNILQHLTKMEQSRIGQPVNKTLWNTAPAVVNAYYSRNKNQIMFPAGILQPPFYHRHFPRSLNYGGIGVVIGHEITHGFDDKGRLFDCDGNLHRWWSDSAIESFHRRAQCLIDQYGEYTVPEVNMKLDGVNTQGENIADNGGVKQAFHAYLHWVEKHGTAGETLPGLNHTHTQLFFLNFAQVWCGAMRPEAMRNKLKTAVHSPGRFRVIGTLSNSHDFAREFRCKPGSPMNPKHKCTVW